MNEASLGFPKLASLSWRLEYRRVTSASEHAELAVADGDVDTHEHQPGNEGPAKGDDGRNQR